MIKLLILGICLATAIQAFSQGKVEMRKDILVARKDFDVSKDWQPRQIMGKDFWHLLQTDRIEPDFFVDNDNPFLRKVESKPLFRESGILYWNQSITVPGSNKVSMAAMEPDVFTKLIEKRPNAPFFVMPTTIRPFYRLIKNFEFDLVAYNKWKLSHPNFMGFINAETDNGFVQYAPWRRKYEKPIDGDNEFMKIIEREFPKPKNREELTAQMLKVCDTSIKYFFNDAEKVGYMSESHFLDHIFGEASKGVLTRETTNTRGGEDGPHYRHQMGLFSARGASRQYQRDWMWYIAFYYNGYDDEGKFTNNNYATYRITKPEQSMPGNNMGMKGPGYGMSPSLIDRRLFLAYLSGPRYVCLEQWWDYVGKTRKGGNPMWDLSTPYGKVWENWFEFTRKNPERGASYAPVALLVPFEQGYPNYGGKSWEIFNYERPDWMIDAFMFTIVPHSPVNKKGNEGALSNGPYGDIFDVIEPNTPIKPVALNVLNNYKVAVMLGSYPKNKALADRLMEYVKNGGTLLLNIKQVNEFFPDEFMGIKRTNELLSNSIHVKSPVSSLIDDNSFGLHEDYECEAVVLKGATPLLKDADGNLLACKNSYGKGNVVLSTIDCMVPMNNMENQEGNVLKSMVYGKTFPFIEYFLKSIVREVLPLEVRGDIEYGLNKISNGWLLYLINNNGVTKFTNREQVLDNSKTAKVEVALKDIRAINITELIGMKVVSKNNKTNSFNVEVPPGGVKIIRIVGDDLRMTSGLTRTQRSE
ncbi:MAG: hypothetical protein M0Q53_09460 [Prolixibacteraceae bacterium]|jgi:hypothetical protein|nr:hypothetical protein [Prolixibacteraceae bacterium]